jgi:serine/threonine protein kinase
MPNGNLLGYIEKYPGANRLELVSLTHWQSTSALTGLQLVGITDGLGYLHSSEVIHGDLKGVRGVYPAVLLDSHTTFPSKTFSSMRKAVPASPILASARSQKTSTQSTLQPLTTAARSVTAPPSSSTFRGL